MATRSLKISGNANNITLLRHFAALFVLISHSYDLMDVSALEPLSLVTGGVISFSRVGLIFFFFISGFLVSQSLVNSSGFMHFLWKRVLRIYPALFVLIFLTVFVLGPALTVFPLNEYFSKAQTWEYFAGGVSLIRLRFFLPGVFDTHGVNGSLWSLPVEFRFYLLLAVLSATGLLKKKMLLLLFVLCCVVAYIALPYLKPTPVVVYLTPYISWAGYFFSGALVFFLRDKIKLDSKILLILLGIWYVSRHIEIAGKVTELVSFSYLALFLSYGTKLIARDFFLRNDFSYSTYIYAFPIQQMLLQIIPGSVQPWMLSMFTLIVLIPFCWFSWSGVEKQALKWKNWLKKEG